MNTKPCAAWSGWGVEIFDRLSEIGFCMSDPQTAAVYARLKEDPDAVLLSVSIPSGGAAWVWCRPDDSAEFLRLQLSLLQQI